MGSRLGLVWECGEHQGRKWEREQQERVVGGLELRGAALGADRAALQTRSC